MKPLILYLIGGSGARFLRSLLYQLSAGIRLKDIDCIRIIIIDTDEANGNYEIALQLLSTYQQIRAKIVAESDAFNVKDGCNLFYHDIALFDESVKFITPLDTRNRTLSSLADYVHLTAEQQDYVNLMLTDKELNENLSIGFQGRPNMGTIGLQAIDKAILKSQKLTNLLGDSPALSDQGLEKAIFFTVSSMFGGMGASGMPLLMNKFSNPVFNYTPIASLSFMYYFKINQGKETNDSKYFPQRTSLAYEYYKTNFGQKLDALYNIGKSFDQETGVQYAAGAKAQNNNGHYIEFFSITALIHFCNTVTAPTNPRQMNTYALHADETMYADAAGKEFDTYFESYIILVFMARYFTDRFEKHYNGDEMKNLAWVKDANFEKFDATEKKLLSEFFAGLLKFEREELHDYSGLKMINSKGFPGNISAAVPHKNYTEHSTGFLSKKRKYDNFAEIDTRGIVDSHTIKTRGHIPRLLVLLNKSFAQMYKNVFN